MDKKLVYIPLLCLGLSACNNQGQTQETNGTQTEIQPSTGSEGSVESASPESVKSIASELYTAFIDKEGNAFFQLNEEKVKDFTQFNKMPCRLDCSPIKIEGVGQQAQTLVPFGYEHHLLGILTTEGKVAFLDIVKAISTGDTQCSGILPQISQATQIKEDGEILIATTEKGEMLGVCPFNMPGYYRCDDFEIWLTRDFRITLTSPSAEISKNGTFFSDPAGLADGPGMSSQLLVASIDGKQYNIRFSYDSHPKRINYTFRFDTDDFALIKDTDINFKHYTSSQSAN